MPEADYEDVLHFWFGSLKDGYPTSDRGKLWFSGAPEVDKEIADRFSSLVEAALERRLRHWEHNARSQLALIILLDQFTRSLFRKTSEAFSGDLKALELAHSALSRGWDQKLALSERTFMYMPLMHSENLKDQEDCIKQFNKLLKDAPENKKNLVQKSIDFAEEHRDIIANYGRFPHRNKALERISTDEEKDHLVQGIDSYGQ